MSTATISPRRAHGLATLATKNATGTAIARHTMVTAPAIRALRTTTQKNE
jgi:hypothetical protein